jgi:hypothetical protein
MLGEVCTFIREVFSPKGWYVDVKIDMDAVDTLHLGISVESYVLSTAMLPQESSMFIYVCVCVCARSRAVACAVTVAGRFPARCCCNSD